MKSLIQQPSMRFNEFSGNWEYNKIGFHIDFLSGFAFKGGDIEDIPTGVILMRGANITSGYIRHSTDLDKFYSGETSKLEKYRVKTGDVVIGMDGSKVGKNSAIVSEKDSGSLLVQRVARLRQIKGSCLDFIYQHISSSKFHDYVDTVKTSSGIPHISASQIKEFTIAFPSLPEQQKIATFLTAVDDKIQQLTRKRALLEKYKKGVMQQIFNQEIRFKDDNGSEYPDWRDMKLGEVGEIIGGGTPDTSIAEFWGGEINWFTPTEIKSKYIDKSIRTITEKGLKQSSAKILPKGSLLLSSRATVGDIGIALHECCTNQGFQSIVVNKNNENEFIYYWVINNKKAFLRKASGSTFLEINKTEISKLKLSCPSKKEQEKIATFLSSLDKKINLVNQQLQKNQSFKKGLLQQMFV